MTKSPLKSIKAFCKQCAGNSRMATQCTTEQCHLYDFRQGKNPYHKGRPGGNPEALVKARLARKNSAINTEF